MAEAIRLVSIGRGIDPRGYALVAAGRRRPDARHGAGRGAGHARDRGAAASRACWPPPGCCARRSSTRCPPRSPRRSPRSICGAIARRRCGELDRQVRRADGGGGRGAGDVEVSHYADICYIGQSYHLQVPLDAGRRRRLTAGLYRDFQAAHDRDLRPPHRQPGADRQSAQRARVPRRRRRSAASRQRIAPLGRPDAERPAGRRWFRGSGAAVEAAHLAARPIAAGHASSPARRSSSRPTPRPWWSPAGRRAWSASGSLC